MVIIFLDPLKTENLIVMKKQIINRVLLGGEASIYGRFLSNEMLFNCTKEHKKTAII